MIEFVLEGINPQPWTVGGRGKQGAHFKSGQLEAYQNALKEEVSAQLDLWIPPEPPYIVEFLFWREIEVGISGYSSRATRGHQSDATNMQKATEDALQKILFDNDRDVRRITSEIIEQGPDVEPKIIIRIDHYVANSS